MSDRLFKKSLKPIFLLLGLVFLLIMIYFLSNILIILAISVLIAFLLKPVIVLLEREGFNRLFSTLILFAGFGLVIYFSLSFIIPKFIIQLNYLLETIHVYSLHDQLLAIELEIYKLIPFFNPGDLAKKVETFISSMIVNSVDQISTLITDLVSIITLLFIIPFITFFLLKDSPQILKGILNIIPNKYFEMSYWILKRVTLQLSKYVRAWIFDATFVGVSMGLGLYLIGVDSALPLGVIAGIGHLVPYFGPVIGGIPAIILSLMQYGNLSQMPFIILLLAVIYTLDNGFVQPVVFSKSLDMHPIVIILLIIAGSELFGLVGMLLAVPTATVLKTAAKEIYFAFKNYNVARL